MRFNSIYFIVVILGFLAVSINPVNAQQNWCGEGVMSQRYLDEHPEEVQGILEIQEEMNKKAQAAENTEGARALKVIPIVFHVIHMNGDENISKLQIDDQVRILNEDYSATNSDLSTVVSSFTNIVGNPQIEFRLARKDPQGNPTDGVDRIVSSKTNQGGDQAKLNPWPRNKYLNVWVVRSWNSTIPNGVLAYAYKPSYAHNNPSVDGIILLSKYVGSIGTSSDYYSRTLTHEIGHFFNLDHPWGSTNDPGIPSNCNTDDGVSDTPNTIGSTSCNLSFISCGSLDNVQNQMDYSFCSVMFTHGQANRMDSAIISSTAQRNQLPTLSNLNATGVGQLSIADFTANRVTVCQGETTDFSDKSTYGPNSWEWTFPSGQANSTTIQNPEVTYNQPGLYDVTLKASDGTDNATTTKVGYLMVNPVFGKYAPYSEDFSSVPTLNNENWYSHNIEEDEFAFGMDANSGFNGSNCVKLTNHGNPIKTKDELLTTTYDLSIFSSVAVSFKLAYAQTKPSDLSRLSLYISNDCGSTWTQKWTGIGPVIATAPINTNAFTPSGNSEWQTINVSTLTGNILQQNSQFKFVFENKGGNNLYLDDFNITGSYTKTAQLKLPEDGRTSLPNNQTLYWKAIGNIDSYEYQLDTDPGFNTSNLITGINPAISNLEGPDTRLETSGLSNGQTYYWRVRLIKNGQPEVWSETWSFTVATNGVSTQDILLEKYNVKVYPNPMKDEGIVSFNLEKGANVSVSIMDLLGQERLIVNQSYLGIGGHVFRIADLNIPTGVYLIKINVDGTNIYKKIIIK